MNYFGEIVFWFGLLVTATPSYGRRITPWVSGLLGFYGIFSIMVGASNRLDKKQEEAYGADPAWKAYAAKTPSLWPKRGLF